MSPSFGLPQSTLDEMRAIFARHNKVTKVVVYGSRAKGNYRNGSDIDLTMFGKNLTFQDLSNIHNALDDSSNPYLVNLSIYNHLDNAKLREHIDRVGQVFYYRYEGWKKVKLGDVVSFVRGLTYSKKDEVDLGGLAVLRATNISLEQRKIIYDEIRHIRPQEKLNKDKLAKVGDLLMCTASGSKSHLGKVALVTEDLGMAFGGFMAALRCNASCSPNFLFYVLTSNLFMKKLSSISEGANINNLKFSQIEDFEFQLPPLAEQQRIVAKLDAAFAEIDDIAKNTETRLASAKAIFENSVKQYFSKENAHCEVKKLSEITNYFNGLTYSPKDVGETGTVVLRSSNIQNGRMDFSDIVRVNKTIKEKLFVQPTDILICSRNGSKSLIGKCSLVGEQDEPMTFGTFMMIVRGECNNYLQWFFKSKLFKEQIAQGENTAINQITRYMLDDVVLPVPDATTQVAISNNLEAIDTEVRRLQFIYQNKINELHALKSAILAQQLQSEAA